MVCKVSKSLPTASAGEAIQRRRKEAGLSRVELAERAHISLRSIYGYEREGRTPAPATALTLALVLDCKPADLRGSDG